MKYCITIRGIVQGVYFRKYTKQCADELGIRGFVCNQPDGSVYIEAEGDEMNLQQFMDRCAEGSPFSKVTEVDVEMKAGEGFVGFGVRG